MPSLDEWFQAVRDHPVFFSTTAALCIGFLLGAAIF